MRNRPGFTLIEIIVALTGATLLLAFLLPAVGDQLRSADATQTVIQLEGIGDAAQRFRMDVGRWPRDVAQLADPPGTGGASNLDVHGRPLDPADAAAWAGPYLDAGRLPRNLETPGVGTIRSPFRVTPWGGDRFFAIAVTGVGEEQADRMRGGSPQTVSRIRWRGGEEDDEGMLIYMVAPLGD